MEPIEQSAAAPTGEHSTNDSASARRISDPNLPALTVPQERALNQLVIGSGVAAAAVSAGVHRGTLHRWLQEDSAFAAAYHARQAETRESARARLMSLTDRAMDAVSDAVEKGDTRAALAVLKGLGLLAPITPGCTNPDEITRQREIDRQKRESDLTTREVMAKLGM